MNNELKIIEDFFETTYGWLVIGIIVGISFSLGLLLSYLGGKSVSCKSCFWKLMFGWIFSAFIFGLIATIIGYKIQIKNSNKLDVKIADRRTKEYKEWSKKRHKKTSTKHLDKSSENLEEIS